MDNKSEEKTDVEINSIFLRNFSRVSLLRRRKVEISKIYLVILSEFNNSKKIHSDSLMEKYKERMRLKIYHIGGNQDSKRFISNRTMMLYFNLLKI